MTGSARDALLLTAFFIAAGTAGMVIAALITGNAWKGPRALQSVLREEDPAAFRRQMIWNLFDPACVVLILLWLALG